MRFVRRAASAIIVASIGLGLAVTTAAAAPPAPSWAATAGAATSCVRVSATIPVGGSPTWVAANPNTGSVYVANNDGTLSVISGRTNTVTATIPTGGLTGVAVDPETNTIY